MLLRIEHRLVPEAHSAFLTGDGAELTVRPVSSARIKPLGTAASRKAFLVRLESLLEFLRFCGLGLAPEDAGAIAVFSRDPSRPLLLRPPVPLWRSASTSGVLAVSALRLSGIEPPVSPARKSFEEWLGGGEHPDLDPIAREVLALVDRSVAGTSGGLLFFRWMPVSGWPKAVLRDCVGLVYPSEFEGETSPLAQAPAVGIGAGGRFTVRGAVRKLFSEADFLELQVPADLSEGVIPAGLNAQLSTDWRVRRLFDETFQERPAEPCRPLILVGTGVENWDRTSQAFWNRCQRYFPWVQRFEVVSEGPPPWTAHRVLVPRLDPGEIGNLVWFPFESPADAQRAWSELSVQATADASRFVRVFESLSWSGRLGGEVAPDPSSAIAKDPILRGAALLPGSFTPDELSVVTGRDLNSLVDVIEAGLHDGIFRPLTEGRFAVAGGSVRREAIERSSLPEREGVLARVQASALPEDRKLAIGLGLRDGVLAEARRRFAQLFDSGHLAAARALLEAAPPQDPVLGSAGRALFTWDAANSTEKALEAAARFDIASDPLPVTRVEEAGLLLARYKQPQKALDLAGLIPERRRKLFTLRVLLNGQRNAEALSLARGSLEPGVGASSDEAMEWRLYVADALSRAGRYEAARKQLDLLLSQGDFASRKSRALEFAFTSGYLCSDLGDQARAEAFFRLAKGVPPMKERGRGQRWTSVFLCSTSAGSRRRATSSRNRWRFSPAFAMPGPTRRRWPTGENSRFGKAGW